MKSILASLLLMVAGLQTVNAQGFRVYKDDGTASQFSMRADSIVFCDDIDGEVDFGPFMPISQSIVGTWYKSNADVVTFNENGTTDYIAGATYEFMPYQGSIIIYKPSATPVSILKVHKVTAEEMIVSMPGGQICVWSRTPPTIINNPLDGYEWVDLGLPSGTLWATCNIGANSPEEYGSYFAWGESSAKNNYSEATYTFDFPAGRAELAASADAATVNWGENWQMPSAAQFDELINELFTTTESVYDDDDDFIGYKITSKGNGNSIYLPYAGFKYDTTGYGGCFYWSRTAGSSKEYGYCLFGTTDGKLYNRGNIMLCPYGATVRPVVKGSGRAVVAKIELNETSLSLLIGETKTLTATVLYEDAENKKVTWSSSNPSVAVVDSDGTVAAIADGFTTITCSATDGSGIKAECKVFVVIDERLSQLIPVEIRDQIDDYIPIYDGVNPPNVEGCYFVDPNILIASSLSEDHELNLIGYEFNEEYHKYSNQDMTANTINMIHVSEGATSWGEDIVAFICGSDDKFTIYVDMIGENRGISNKMIYVISGIKSSNGIKDLIYGFYMKEKGSDPDNLVVPVGTYRFFKDKDGMSDSVSWPFGNRLGSSKNINNIRMPVRPDIQSYKYNWR